MDLLECGHRVRPTKSDRDYRDSPKVEGKYSPKDRPKSRYCRRCLDVANAKRDLEILRRRARDSAGRDKRSYSWPLREVCVRERRAGKKLWEVLECGHQLEVPYDELGGQYRINKRRRCRECWDAELARWDRDKVSHRLVDLDEVIQGGPGASGEPQDERAVPVVSEEGAGGDRPARSPGVVPGGES